MRSQRGFASAGVKNIVDVRLHNTSQLVGFAKAADLVCLLKKIGDIQYEHQLLLASTDAMLKAYKGYWRTYAQSVSPRNRERR